MGQLLIVILCCRRFISILARLRMTDSRPAVFCKGTENMNKLWSWASYIFRWFSSFLSITVVVWWFSSNCQHSTSRKSKKRERYLTNLIIHFMWLRTNNYLDIHVQCPCCKSHLLGFHLYHSFFSIFVLFVFQIIDPFVEVEVIGLPVDCFKEQTRVVDDNGKIIWDLCFLWLKHHLSDKFCS